LKDHTELESLREKINAISPLLYQQPQRLSHFDRSNHLAVLALFKNNIAKTSQTKIKMIAKTFPSTGVALRGWWRLFETVNVW